jgi:hypothetical protein
MKRLPRVRARLQAELTAAKAAELRDVERADLTELPFDSETIKDVEAKLSALDRIGRTVSQSGGKPPGQRYYLLGLDGSGDGKAIVAEGNPDTARNAATFVPGVGSKLASFDESLAHSRRMYRAARKAGSKSTSVITWVGYDAPDSVLAAISTSYADEGKADLTRFEQGLRATHEGVPSHNVAIGHSYGTTLVGHAARDGHPPVDDVVFVASPGVGVDRARELNIPPEHVYSTVAENDIINVTNPPRWPNGESDPIDPLGPDPTDPAFGGHTFASAPGESNWWEGGMSVDAHSSYWDKGNPALANLGKIIAGKPPTAH